ncbi:MAG: hypothetical protein ACJ8FT_10715 [Sphingomonas sp.]
MAAAKRAKQNLILSGVVKPQLQRSSRRSWTKDKEQEFLSVLADTCNVTRAAEAVGMSGRGAYKRRSTNAAFRAAWLEVLSVAYQRLEPALLDRAFNGTEKVIRRHDGSEDRMREYPNQLGLSLLKMHRSTVVEAIAEPPSDEIHECASAS